MPVAVSLLAVVPEPAQAVSKIEVIKTKANFFIEQSLHNQMKKKTDYPNKFTKIQVSGSLKIERIVIFANEGIQFSY